MDNGWKDTNPKDGIGVRKWRQITCVPFTVLWELGAAMLEGGVKYGRHNYRAAGVRESVYIDAAMGHLMQYWEGEDVDQDSGLSHITKAIASLAVLRDAQINGMTTDDRPVKPAGFDKLREDLQVQVEHILDNTKRPDHIQDWTETRMEEAKGEPDPCEPAPTTTLDQIDMYQPFLMLGRNDDECPRWTRSADWGDAYMRVPCSVLGGARIVALHTEANAFRGRGCFTFTGNKAPLFDVQELAVSKLTRDQAAIRDYIMLTTM